MTTNIGRCTEQPPAWLTLSSQDRLVARGIRRFRHERSLSIHAAATLFSYSGGYLSRIERGVRPPPDPVIAAAILGVTPEQLLARCPQCHYRPPPGYTCQRCGSEAPLGTGEQPVNCTACFHLWRLHAGGKCTGRVYPPHSLDGEPCPCQYRAPDETGEGVS